MSGRAREGMLQALRAGRPQLMLGVRISRTTDIVRIAKSTGYDCLMIDLEHSALTVGEATQLCATAGDVGLTAMVRVPEREYGIIGRLLDGGAHGIIAPRVEGAGEARALVAACRFPPRGHRSQLTQLPQRGMTPTSAAELNPSVDAETIVKVLIESPTGVDNAAEIAAVDGLDIVGIGLNDLAAELGVPGDFDDPRLAAAVASVADAARAAGKIAMAGGAPQGERMTAFLSAGMAPLLLAGMDSDLIYRAAEARAAEWRAWHDSALGAG